MKSLKLLILLSPLSLCSVSIADEAYQHFPSIESNNLNTALCNLKNYNQKIQPLLTASNPTAEQMVQVHELTYTLENALAQLEKDLEEMAEDLEEVHLASERLDNQTIITKGKEYLEATNTLLNGANCQTE